MRVMVAAAAMGTRLAGVDRADETGVQTSIG